MIIWRIIVPLSKPAIATVVIFTFWWTWNSFLEPFIFLSSPELFPVSVGLNFFKDQYGAVYYDRLISASVMSMIPMLVIYPLTFLGGAFYSLDMLPAAWRTVTLFNPVVYLISGFRWTFFGQGDVGFDVSIAAVALFFALCLGVIFWMFRTGYRLKN